MKDLKLRIWPDPILKQKCEDVTVFDEELNETVIEMFKLMYVADGTGLAAPQAGLAKRILVYKVDGVEGVLINPLVIWASEDKQEIEEGCLSFPGAKFLVKRSFSIRVEAQDTKGEKVALEAKGPLSQCIQHEVDHLDGVVFTKYISSLKRDIINRKMTKIAKKIQRIKKNDSTRIREPNRRDTGVQQLPIPTTQV
jgi:peptide deformylase